VAKNPFYNYFSNKSTILEKMSSVKNTAEFLRNLGLSSNSKPRESGNELSGGYSPKNVAKELFLTPEKEVGNFSGSKRKV